MGVDYYPCTGGCGEVVNDYDYLDVHKWDGTHEDGYYCETCSLEVRTNNVPKHSGISLLFRFKAKRPHVFELQSIVPCLLAPLLQIIINYYANEFFCYLMQSIERITMLQLRDYLWYATSAECMECIGPMLSSRFDDHSLLEAWAYQCEMPAKCHNIVPLHAGDMKIPYNFFVKYCQGVFEGNNQWFEPPPFVEKPKKQRLADKIYILEEQLQRKRQKLENYEKQPPTEEDQQEINRQFLAWKCN